MWKSSAVLAQVQRRPGLSSNTTTAAGESAAAAVARCHGGSDVLPCLQSRKHGCSFSSEPLRSRRSAPPAELAVGTAASDAQRTAERLLLRAAVLLLDASRTQRDAGCSISRPLSRTPDLAILPSREPSNAATRTCGQGPNSYAEAAGIKRGPLTMDHLSMSLVWSISSRRGGSGKPTFACAYVHTGKRDVVFATSASRFGTNPVPDLTILPKCPTFRLENIQSLAFASPITACGRARTRGANKDEPTAE
ncbi:hypothetical protein CCMA1212_000990 [Trichoderma ghanense]|uniref:Uncharacterized protein n=1 Tax=Trichoderma ghanense TaxID=65468 RepID=A0ABY2HGA7_9HYPO